MARDPDKAPKRQKTPRGKTIPVPKRDDVMRDLRKLAKPKPKPDEDSESPPRGPKDQKLE